MAATSSGVDHADIRKQLECLFLHPSSPRPWRLEVAPSSAPGAGEGVFIHGEAKAGMVLAVYPGVSFETEDLPTMHQIVLPGNDYVLMRRDGVLIDGRPDGSSAQLFAVAEQRDRAAGHAPLIRNGELHVGNKVNHPSGGALPNVAVAPIDLCGGDPLDAHIPSLCFRPPSEGEPTKRTAVLIASRALHNEELWLDYKLRPQGPLEAWYKPVQHQQQSDSKGN
jgi:hypothetical protein